MMRWTIAAVGAVGLAFMALHAPAPWAAEEAAGADGAACDAKGRVADLNYTLKDMTNSNVKLSAFKGKVIVLDFWATWCGPCKLEIPGFVDLQQKYGAQGLQFIGISVDDRIEQLRPYVADFKINYPVLQGRGRDEVQDAFGPIFGIPTTVVIGRDGKICRRHEGMTQKDVFEKEIRSLL